MGSAGAAAAGSAGGGSDHDARHRRFGSAPSPPLRGRGGKTATALASGLFALTGCASLDRHKPATPPVALAESTGLSPDQATAALAATAAELARQGYDADAADRYEQARRACGKPDRWAAELAAVYDRLGADDRAAAEFDRALKAAPADPDVLNDRGCFHSARGDWAAAEGSFDQALKAKPGHPRATVNRAVVFAKTGRVEQARAEFGKVLTPAEAEFNLGVLLAGTGDAAAARDRLTAAAAAAPDSARPRAVLAKLDASQGASAPAANSALTASTPEVRR